MGKGPDENLPEVVPGNAPQTVPDGSPQALTAEEAHAHQRYLDGEAKYPGEDYGGSPKLADVSVGLESASYETGHGYQYQYQYQHQQQGADPQSGVPWGQPASPLSAGSGIHAGVVPGSSQLGSEGEKERASEERICGLKKRVFYLVLGACIIIVAIVVGVGVGVSLASQNRGSGQAASSDGGGGPTQENVGPSDNPNGSPSSSVEPPLPQPTAKVPPPKLNETRLNGPFKFQGWSGVNFTGESTPVVRGLGITQFDFKLRSYVWDPDGYTCCISFCNGTVSSRGSYRCLVFPQPEASGTFDRIVTVCGGNEITKQAASCS